MTKIVVFNTQFVSMVTTLYQFLRLYTIEKEVQEENLL
jgi:hypothetical protein